MPISTFETHPGLPEIELSHGDVRVRLSLQGAHITHYEVAGEPLLWVSDTAVYARGASIRGGIPLCWPWFGESLDEPSWPQHGFARRSQFYVRSQSEDAHQTSVVLVLDDQIDIAPWHSAAALELEVRVSDHLRMALSTTNTSDQTLKVGAGLHSYFAVSDRSQVTIPELTGLAYLDKPSGFTPMTQVSPLTLDGEIDRVFVDAPSSIELLDPGFSRRIAVDSWGNTDLVIWNPGALVAARMQDFDDEGYQRMVCIEPAIALDRRIELAPGESHVIGQTIRRLPL